MSPEKKVSERSRRSQRSPMTVKHKTLFLEALKTTGTITGACQKTGIVRRTFYNWLHADPLFAEQYEEANLEVTEVLETKGLSDAMKGDSDLLKFFLRARKPDTYRENITVRSTGIVAQVPIDLSTVPQEKLDALIRALEQAG